MIHHLLLITLVFACLAQSRAEGIAMPARGLCAHRGAMSTHPENTLPAVKEAVRLGAHMIEFDIQLTKDDALVLMHDAMVDRTTNGKGKVADHTLAELKLLDAGSKMSQKFAGKTWTDPAPSTLVHPDAPPMLFPPSDGKTLVAFHHNKVPTTGNGELSDKAELMKMRSEVWESLSTDEGHTWSEPRFVLANAAAPVHKVSGFNSQCSYIDTFTEDGVMHLFMPHRWLQVLHLTIKEDALGKLPTKSQLQKIAAPAAKTPIFTTAISAKLEPTRRVVHKKVGSRELALDIFEPAGFQKSDKRACFVAIHGGGWTSGSPRSMYVFADHCAKLGMVAISVQYRLYKAKTPVTVFECVKDARAAPAGGRGEEEWQVRMR